MNIDDESIFERLTRLDDKSKLKIKRHDPNSPFDEPTRLVYSTFLELKGDVEEKIERGYSDLTALALIHVLCSLIDDINRNDPVLGRKLHQKAMELLAGVG